MDTKFSSAVHALILISEAETPMNSEQIANSVGTNASYIRKLTTRLRKAGIIESHRGVSGFTLNKEADEITMLDIYKAVMETDEIHLFDIHQNPNDQCIVGHNIKPVLSSMFQDLEGQMERQLSRLTLADCINDMKTYISENSK
ncbi:Rrf2 family transcriptional regulator [Eubacterium sp. F2]|jgi:Rrf2 family protein|uniref:Rrf2 family transcriptional regulator n=1 Tax=Eubacterium sp. F2 TaxID=3381348 RepID=UPI00390820F3